MRIEFGVDYYINEEKKIVICKLTNCEGSLQCDMCQRGWPHHPDLFINDSFVGKAKCSDEDTFDVEFGKKLAYQRAVAKLNTAKVKTLKRFKEEQEASINELFKTLDTISGKCERIIASKEATIKSMFEE